ncbi:DUF2750 domain-containing protein [Lysobacter sp. BMK333-48F3]|uniref:DUF2750 domain-containing protein n=1 Tax=Lysobacter sp. BMK333-48F3 TaxID=2867962 RepID=UPI001C8B306C|nr:DUF2750 domain-containing protein [Lysobacter sp. BMK333-48F3]MBX9401211.1 DUF2750 domain-containing protein [Lysobacter sp. BMK333-48F3]
MHDLDESDPQRLLDYLELSAPERYAAWLDAVAREGRLWVAVSGDYVLTLFDEDGQELLPVWPSAETAQASLASAAKLRDYAPASRELAAWRERAVPALDQDGLLVGVFPNAQRQCAAVAPAQVLAHLDALLADQAGDGEADEAGDSAAEGIDLEQARRALAQKFAQPKD